VADKIVLKLEGADARRGLPLSALENFVERLSRALVDFDRSQRGQQTRKSGRRTAREEHLIGFRVVEMRPGSAIMELEPLASDEEEGGAFEVETLAIANLRAFLDAVESSEKLLDPDVTQSIEAARRALGADGRIGVAMSSDHDRRNVVIDEHRVEEIAQRRPRRQELVNHVSGQLTMVDIEPPFRVAIRSSNGVRWNCRYPQDLEQLVASLLKHQVSAGGSGVLVNARRGYFEIETLEEIQEFEQTPLFSIERRPLAELLREQAVTRPQGWAAFADPDWREGEEDELYVRTLMREG
jgi:hypothetical protein